MTAVTLWITAGLLSQMALIESIAARRLRTGLLALMFFVLAAEDGVQGDRRASLISIACGTISGRQWYEGSGIAPFPGGT